MTHERHFPDVDLWAVLETVRLRPAMWMGRKSLWSLAAYIAGLFQFAQSSHGSGPKCLNLLSDPPYEEFMRVRDGKLYGGPYTEARLIAVERGNLPSVPEGMDPVDVAAFDIWFELLDEFKKRHGRP